MSEKIKKLKAIELNEKQRVANREKLAMIKTRLAEQRKARADRREKAKAEAKKLAEKKQLKSGKEATP